MILSGLHLHLSPKTLRGLICVPVSCSFSPAVAFAAAARNLHQSVLLFGNGGQFLQHVEGDEKGSEWVQPE